MIGVVLVAGCLTAPKIPQQEEIENLERVLSTERMALNVCETELAKNGKYVVRLGDTLARIGKVHGIEVKDIISLNPGLQSTHIISVGMVLKLKETQPNHTSDGIRQPADGSPKPSM